MTRRLFVYLVAITAALAAVTGLIHVGEARLAPRAAAVAAPAGTGGAFAQMVDSMGATPAAPAPPAGRHRHCGAGSRRSSRALGQPPVIGEIAAGLLLGPSLLGGWRRMRARSSSPPASLPMLQLLSQVGVLLFMFVVGVELDASHLRGRAQTAVAVSHFSIVVPFMLGVAAVAALYRDYAPPACRSTPSRCSSASR